MFNLWPAFSIVRLVSSLFSYLGLPIEARSKVKVVWYPVVQNFGRKLSMWKPSYLCLGEMITLIKAALPNLPVYYMPLMLMSVPIRNKLERIRRIFCEKAAMKKKGSPHEMERCH